MEWISGCYLLECGFNGLGTRKKSSGMISVDVIHLNRIYVHSCRSGMGCNLDEIV